MVERIINKVINENIDIDKILVVTFTNASASEMRERILDAIYKKLEENPDSVNLQRQITLLNKANICTIHSFCLDVIRNNFYEIDVSSNFRIGDTTEIEMMKTDVLEDLFEQKYMENDSGFIKLIETYTDYRGDEKLQNLILNIYKNIQSNPFPEKWLNEKINEFNIDLNNGFENTIWGKIILEHLKEEINSMVLKLEKIKKDLSHFYELDKFTRVLQEDINSLKTIKLDNWEIAYEGMNSLKWNKWPVDKKVTIDLKNEAKEIRDRIKKEFAKLVLKYNSKEANQDILDMHNILLEIERIVLEFTNNFANKKKEKNLIDFNDIEHFALKILLDKDGNSTAIAKKYQDKFNEILIDEYQDSNLVQEKILTSISTGNNIFMVGDVKQSIYKFRQARPELFLEKYENYKLKNELQDSSKGEKIQLFKNFRSRKNILDITNLVFENIMSRKLGNIEYNSEEYLNYGANYPEPDENLDFAGIAELNIIDLKELEENFYKDEKNNDGFIDEKSKNDSFEGNFNQKNNLNSLDQESNLEKNNLENNEDDEENQQERVEDAVLEASFVANKILDLLKSNYYTYDRKQGYRKIKAKDICVLLRATSVLAPIYEKEISERGIPVFSDSSDTYLESMEVQTIMSLLQIIDNPLQDIPFVTVLRSNIFGFTDNELIKIRKNNKKCPSYEAMLKSRISVENDLRHKIDLVIDSLKKWKEEEEYTPLNEFIWKIYIDTGFYNYVMLLPNGNLRQANLKMLFEKAKQFENVSFKGLFSFINFINKVKTSSGDMSSAKLVGENDDVVRIMSIHKSKGLEFPVVFLSSTGKKFNMQDLNTPILMHEELGFGPQFIDPEKKIEYPTLAKEAIRIKTREETISEEMRVLYVALTRAKEKLIITGMGRNIEEKLKEKEKMLEIYKIQDSFEKTPYKEHLEENKNLNELGMTTNRESKKIDFNLIGKYNSYLDWLELVYENNKKSINDIMKLKIYNKKDIVHKLKTKEETKIDIEEILKNEKISSNKEEKNETNYELEQEILKELNWKYPFERKIKIPTKTSVTKLKELGEEQSEYDIEELVQMKRKMKYIIDNEATTEAKEEKSILEDIKNKYSNLDKKPKFVEQNLKLTGAQKGTLLHLCVQLLDEKREYNIENIKKFIENLKNRNIISDLETKSIDINILYRYTHSTLWEDLKLAREIHKEEPFYINLKANTIYDEAEEDETILVQGVIDLYYINKEGKLILVDYKTDYVSDGDVSKLEEKYKVQLDLYKTALEQSLERKVDKAMIWLLK